MAKHSELTAGVGFRVISTERTGRINDEGGYGQFQAEYDDQPGTLLPLPPLEDLIILPTGSRPPKMQHSE
jgi:hypothetical protein